MKTFTIRTKCRTPFQVSEKPTGKFSVERFNRETGETERWALCDTRAEAESMRDSVNREIASNQTEK